MLKSRAITQCARDACQEALNGVQYTPEELGANVSIGEDDEQHVVTQIADLPPITQPTVRAKPVEIPDDFAGRVDAAPDAAALRALWTEAGTGKFLTDALKGYIQDAVRAINDKADAEAAKPKVEDIVEAEVVEETTSDFDDATSSSSPAEVDDVWDIK